MSLFINSKVHLQSNCEKCPFNYADMSVGICIAADKTIDTRTYGRKRHPDCPMTELPSPHGRLIDADRLLESIKTNFYEHFGNYDSGQELLFDLICNSIEDSLTIIEAEVSE